MIPIWRDPEDDPTFSDLVECSADRDQSDSDSDRTGSDRDQGAADLDQLAADSDQAASDRAFARGVDGDAYASSREARERTTQVRRETSIERNITASARDANAQKRDLSALARDRGAGLRDLEDDRRDAEIASLTSFFRTRAQADERDENEVDMLTGTQRLGPGLADMQREIHRANRGNGRLVVACVNVDGLKPTNDSKGRAVDVILVHVMNVLQTNLRSHESIIRLGGDEFVCTISDASIENVRELFDEIIAELGIAPEDGSISVGFAELVRGDSPMDLIDRADRRLVASRDTQTRDR
jgi:diguanylate cyclase (GGDEF)-like protein